MTSIILLNKPYQVLCQFRSDDDRATLKDYVSDHPGYYPAGRLDYDSEGLLLLTNDGKLQNRISDPEHKLKKTYWAQVEGIPDEDSLSRFRAGLQLKDGQTRPAAIQILNEQRIATIWPRTPPIRERQAIPTTWLEIVLTEGKNRQVRRMTAAIGHPTLRLIRYAIGSWTLDAIKPGHYREIAVHLPQPSKPRRQPNHGKKRPSRHREKK